jgi:uncharacterized protein YfdQ (DUF2303 family)
LSEAQSIAALAVKAAGVAEVIKTELGREFLILPEGQKHVDVTEPNSVDPVLPDFIRQQVTVQTVESLIKYTNRFKTETTVLFADISSNSIKAMINYHGPTSPAHNTHVVTMVLPFSEEWKIWTGVNGSLQSQLEFARFLEENSADVVDPSGAELLEACRDLQAIRKVDFKRAVRTSSDNECFSYTDETNATTRSGDVEIPTKFLLEIPVYFGESPMSLSAFLRWKLDDGHLMLGVKLHRLEHVRQAIFKQIVVDAADQTKCPVVFGKPA